MAKRDWDSILAKIREDHPEIRGLQWGNILRSDPRLLGGMINDIIKASNSSRGKPGKRVSSSPEEIAVDLLKLQNDDFSTLPFDETLQMLMTGKSLRHMQSLSGISKDKIRRLMWGVQKPSVQEMESLAKALRKDPSFFSEYRAGWVCSVLYEMLIQTEMDEPSIFYTKLQKYV